MRRSKALIKKLFTPVTVMLIPHGCSKPFSFKLPSIGLILAVALALGVAGYSTRVSVNAAQYSQMKSKLDYYTGQFLQMQSTFTALQKSQEEFSKLLGLKTKQDILEKYKDTDSGSIDLDLLKKKIDYSMETVAQIKQYLANEKSQYNAIPRGWPVVGDITSPFGPRVDPINGKQGFHTGMDIQANEGTPVRATADGVIIVAGPVGGNGNLVGIADGHGYQTFYAHNSKIIVTVGQVVKRGQIISYSGSTGHSTGPHVHYEVHKDDKPVNPLPYVLGKVS